MGGTYSTNESYEKFTKLSSKNLKERDHLEVLSVDGLRSEWILGK
jgi:hypothetical protein